MKSFKILVFGDIVGAIGRKGITTVLPELRKEFAPDLVIANVENLSHGRGITHKSLLELDALGIDAFTSGNHVWENAQGLSCFSDEKWKGRLIRPANVAEHLEGKGSMVIEKNGAHILIINLLGQLFMKDATSSAFTTFDTLLQPADLTLVDLHTEATSEKEAFGHYVDGRATAVWGTHTHVPTADQKILPGGTAYVTDIGRNGGYDSVVGFEKNGAVQRYLGSKIKSYDPTPDGKVEVNAILITADLETGKATALDRIRKIVDS